MSRLIRLDNGKLVIAFDGGSTVRLAAESSAEETEASEKPIALDVLGYRQTTKNAIDGGKPNANGFRIRNGAMRAFARSFAGSPFLTGHDWGDVTKRYGTVRKGWAAEIEGSDEVGAYQRVEIHTRAGREAYAEGVIDRYSIGAVGAGEVMCTAHESPVWTDCYCFPGEVLEDGRIAEWEYQAAVGVELSAVNVPAVEGTGHEEVAVAELAELCGRSAPPEILARRGGRLGLSATRPAAITMAMDHQHQPEDHHMERQEMALALGLPESATWEQIRAEITRRDSHSAKLAAQNDTLYQQQQVSELTAAHDVPSGAVDQLRERANAGGKFHRDVFDAGIALLAAAAPKRTAQQAAPAPAIQAAPAILQSSAAPAQAQVVWSSDSEQTAIDVFGANPELQSVCKRMGITLEQIKKHGPKAIATVNTSTIASNPMVARLARAGA